MHQGKQKPDVVRAPATFSLTRFRGRGEADELRLAELSINHSEQRIPNRGAGVEYQSAQIPLSIIVGRILRRTTDEFITRSTGRRIVIPRTKMRKEAKIWLRGLNSQVLMSDGALQVALPVFLASSKA